MVQRQRKIPEESMVDLHRRIGALPAKSSERRLLIQQTALLYGLSEATLYRELRCWRRPRAVRRADRGEPRIFPREELERFCEVIAAIKLRTSNKKRRHLSTGEAIRLLEEYGVGTPEGQVRVAKDTLKITTVNRYLRTWGLDGGTLCRQPPAVRFQAHHSNDCWHFDLSPSDLKEVKEPLWMEEGRGHPLLMIYSVVDDRSGMAYQEYHCVYGEDVEAALRFLFNAMTRKKEDGLTFQGIPRMIYTDNGPISRSHVFQQVMKYLGIELRTHMPKGSDGRRVTARAKGKVERPFRTVKEMHETLYHFHEPRNEEEANAWLMKYLVRYNGMDHRLEPHSRQEDWLQNLPPEGVREMCSWERFCTFAREPERRRVGADARVRVDGASYEVEPDLAGEEVVLWRGVFDQELYVEHGEKRYGPYQVVGGPILLHRYRQFKKSRTQRRADRIEALAEKLTLPKSALTGEDDPQREGEMASVPTTPFIDPDPFREFFFPSKLVAKQAIAEFLGRPLAKLEPEQMADIEQVLVETLEKEKVLAKCRELFKTSARR